MIRRTLLKNLGALTAGSLLASSPVSGKTRKEPVLRIAHLTDMHLPEKNPEVEKKMVKMLSDIRAQKVDFFLNGGDTIMDASYKEVTREKMLSQWEVFDRIRSSINDMEMHSCIGNHDCWWAAPSESDEMYGKDYVVKRLNISSRYYSFDRQGWHFIIIDGNNSKTTLDEEQFKWLEADLQKLKTGTPVLLMSHFPVFGATPLLVGGNHTDNGRLKSLFYKHKDKVRVMLSGHNHLYDETLYNDVLYCCNGAVSGFWWGKGDENSASPGYYFETPPGYAILDLHSDGTVQNKYIAYPY